MNEYLVVYNPAAGQGRAGLRLAAVEAMLRERDIAYRLCLTTAPGHAVDVAYEAARENLVRGIVAAGGDGTVNEVLNGIARARREGATTPPLGVLCMGRGNDFAFGAGIPADLAGGVETLATGVAAPMDIGHLTGGLFPAGRYFGNGIGIGFDTIVGFEAARMKRIKGFAGYIVGALKALFLYYRAPVLAITTDDGVVMRPSIQISVMNGRRMGGAFLMAPGAVVDDGFLDLCIAGSPTRRQMLSLILRYLKGTQEGHEHITTGRTRRFAVISEDGGIAIHADGETVSVDHMSLEVECIRAGVDVLRPASSSDPVVASEDAASRVE